MPGPRDNGGHLMEMHVFCYDGIICSPTSNHLHQLQVDNCDRNSRLVVDEDDNERFKRVYIWLYPTLL